MTNKELAKTAMTELFINGDLTALDRYWVADYIQHNPGIPNGTEHVRKMMAAAAPDFKYEMGQIIAEGEFVVVNGRYTGYGPKPLVAVDIFKIKNGKFAEHWDILQEEVPAEKTASGNPMFPVK